MIFVQNGVSSLAFTAKKMPELMASVTHTPLDTPEIIDPSKLVEPALAVSSLINLLLIFAIDADKSRRFYGVSKSNSCASRSGSV